MASFNDMDELESQLAKSRDNIAENIQLLSDKLSPDKLKDRVKKFFTKPPVMLGGGLIAVFIFWRLVKRIFGR